MVLKGVKLSDVSKISISLILGGFVIIGVSFYFFAELAEEVMEKEPLIIDKLAINMMNNIQQAWLGNAFGMITEAGSVLWLSIASGLLLVYLLFISDKSKWVSVYFLVNMLGISLLTKVLKLAFERKRPDILEKYDGTGFSFPSGHSTGAIVFYGFVIYIVFITNMKSSVKWILNSFLGLLILLVGLSRVYVGVHYFSDILAGFSFGLAWLLICILALEVTLWRQQRRQKKKQEALFS
ncbi:phosphatase PAP2 family protein [Pontibacillus yanchengensis]|uniref:Phosphatase PAP2 family protein n=2 Tax=Pontibacillus yanchengensis TaxID=462910 RepID=A0A6I4ZYU0_9BACI|nr:phosphatase PAP2 family protein [Pontibacillus yanchengensis]MYL53608.1 phosphatase PAP2 family protein [Pontibacillus yanchengensis]